MLGKAVSPQPGKSISHSSSAVSRLSFQRAVPWGRRLVEQQRSWVGRRIFNNLRLRIILPREEGIKNKSEDEKAQRSLRSSSFFPVRCQIVEVMESRRQIERIVRHEGPVGIGAGDQVQVLLVAEHAGRLEYLGVGGVAHPLRSGHRSGVELEDARSPTGIVPVLVSADAVEDAVEVGGPPHLSEVCQQILGISCTLHCLSDSMTLESLNG